MNVRKIRHKISRLEQCYKANNSICKSTISATLNLACIHEFEQAHNVLLPEDYKSFLNKIGNGGLGPEYGLLSLYESIVDFKLQHKPEINISEEFKYKNYWNENWIDTINWEDGERPSATQLNQYMDVEHISGCLQICHIGHGATYLLVVKGFEYGNIWIDERADYGGLKPCLKKDGSTCTFIEWYLDWLDKTLAAVL